MALLDHVYRVFHKSYILEIHHYVCTGIPISDMKVSPYFSCETFQKTGILLCTHRVDRVLGFFFNVHLLGPSPSHPQAIVPPPPLWSRGGHTCGRGGRGVPIRTREQTMWYFMSISGSISMNRCVYYKLWIYF